MQAAALDLQDRAAPVVGERFEKSDQLGAIGRVCAEIIACESVQQTDWAKRRFGIDGRGYQVRVTVMVWNPVPCGKWSARLTGMDGSCAPASSNEVDAARWAVSEGSMPLF